MLNICPDYQKLEKFLLKITVAFVLAFISCQTGGIPVILLKISNELYWIFCFKCYNAEEENIPYYLILMFHIFQLLTKKGKKMNNNSVSCLNLTANWLAILIWTLFYLLIPTFSYFSPLCEVLFSFFLWCCLSGQPLTRRSTNTQKLSETVSSPLI